MSTKLEFEYLSEIACSQYVALNTNPLVRCQMPLTADKFSVTILFPPMCTRIREILRLGLQPDGEVEIAAERFIRYRSCAPGLQDK